MPKQVIQVTAYECTRCLYRWLTWHNGKESSEVPRCCARCKSNLWDTPRRNNMTEFYKNQMEGRPLNRVSERTRKATMDKTISAKTSLEWIKAEKEERIQKASQEIRDKASQISRKVLPSVKSVPTLSKLNLKQERVECLKCHKPAVRYKGRIKSDGGVEIIYEHRDEPPIGMVKRQGGNQMYRYRRCSAGFSYDFQKIFDEIREVQEQEQEPEPPASNTIVDVSPPSNMISNISVDPEGKYELYKYSYFGILTSIIPTSIW